MKKQSMIVSFLIAGLMALPAVSMAKEGKESGDMERSKTMTKERMMTHDHSDDHDAIMSRDQLREKTKDKLGDGSGIYGSEMMNDDEIKEYRERIHAAKTEKERKKIIHKHREAMKARAKTKGIKLADDE